MAFPNCITRWKLPSRTCDARTEGWNLNGESEKWEEFLRFVYISNIGGEISTDFSGLDLVASP